MAADPGAAHPGPSVVPRVVSLLATCDQSHVAMSLTDISRRSGLPLSTTHRLLAELESWRAVERGDDGDYRVGRRLWQLGTLAPVQAEFREVALPYMQDLFVATREDNRSTGRCPCAWRAARAARCRCTRPASTRPCSPTHRPRSSTRACRTSRGWRPTPSSIVADGGRACRRAESRLCQERRGDDGGRCRDLTWAFRPAGLTFPCGCARRARSRAWYRG